MSGVVYVFKFNSLKGGGMMRYFEATIKIIVVTLLSALLLTVCLQIFSRFSDFGVPWGTELATFLFIWLVFISGYFTIKKGLNITFDIVIDLLPGVSWKILFTITNLISITFLGLIAYLGFGIVQELGSVSPVLKIPMSIIYAAIPIGAIVMLVAQVETYFILIKKGNESV